MKPLLRVLLLGLALLLTAGLGGFAPAPAAAAAGPVVLDSLTVPATATPGQNLTASARVHSGSGTVTAQAVTVAVRNSAGTAFDFPGATAASIPTGGYTFTSGQRSFVAGTYDVFVAVQVGGQWTNLNPHKTLTVAAAPATVVLDTLTVPATATPGQNVAASARVHASSGTIAAQAVTIAVRNSAGTDFDFPGATAASIPTGGYTFTPGQRSFPAGTYDVFVAVQVGGQWTNLNPHKTLTVAATANPVTFSQDFNGPAGAGPNHNEATPIWFTDPCWSNEEACTGSLAQYKDDHARLDGQGSLVLTADTAFDPGARCEPVACSYASARLTMLDWAGNGGRPTKPQAGGHIEARIKAPIGRGLWPAFWMVGDQVNGEWPATGEIDIMEVLGHQPTVVHQFAHGGQPDINSGDDYTLPSGDVTGWHTYAIDWDASANGYLKWSVDGVVTRTFTAAQAGAAWSSFRGPEAIIVNLAVGGDWPGPPDASTAFPARMYVDYIRAYERPFV